MKPSELSRSLRHIAAKVDASKRPDRVLVARDLKRVLAAVKGLSEKEKKILTPVVNGVLEDNVDSYIGIYEFQSAIEKIPGFENREVNYDESDINFYNLVGLSSGYDVEESGHDEFYVKKEGEEGVSKGKDEEDYLRIVVIPGGTSEIIDRILSKMDKQFLKYSTSRTDDYDFDLEENEIGVTGYSDKFNEKLLIQSFKGFVPTGTKFYDPGSFDHPAETFTYKLIE